MRIGIDFGTSYSAAGAVLQDGLQLVRFGGEPQFRTTVYFPQQLPDAGRFELTPELEREVASLVRGSQDFEREQQARARKAREDAMRLAPDRRDAALALVPTATQRTPQQHRDAAIAAVRRQWLAERARAALDAGIDLQTALYGEEAVDAYLANAGSGHLIVSPKSMLGYQLVGNAREVLVGISTHILRHIRETASRQFGQEVRQAVLGRPVRFRSSMGEAGGAQAIQLLTDAASAAGFEAVEFLEEPAAAAIHYHRQQATPVRALVVDIGGGTSDLALAQVGGDAAKPDVLRAWGEPIGGTDVDLELSMRTVMPLFGKGVTRTPVHHFYKASAVQDTQRQASFRRANFAEVEAPYGERLQTLQQAGNTVRVAREVELAKIRLSSEPDARLSLEDIEAGLATMARQDQLDEAAGRFASILRTLLRQAQAEMDAAPDVVYLTGGMSRSPYVAAVAGEVFAEAEVVRGDASLGVVSGLALTADSD